MLVHSYLYYVLDSPIINDHVWQQWANELAILQTQHQADIGWYDSEFKDWTGDTGMHLPKNEWIINKALQLLRIHNILINNRK